MAGEGGPSWWRKGAGDDLFAPPADYLEQAGLEPAATTAGVPLGLRFGIFTATAPPSYPWYRGEQIAAIRYRYHQTGRPAGGA